MQVSSGSPAAVATIAQPSYGMIAILSRAAELNYEVIFVEINIAGILLTCVNYRIKS